MVRHLLSSGADIMPGGMTFLRKAPFSTPTVSRNTSDSLFYLVFSFDPLVTSRAFQNRASYECWHRKPGSNRPHLSWSYIAGGQARQVGSKGQGRDAEPHSQCRTLLTDSPLVHRPGAPVTGNGDTLNCRRPSAPAIVVGPFVPASNRGLQQH